MPNPSKHCSTLVLCFTLHSVDLGVGALYPYPHKSELHNQYNRQRVKPHPTPHKQSNATSALRTPEHYPVQQNPARLTGLSVRADTESEASVRHPLSSLKCTPQMVAPVHRYRIRRRAPGPAPHAPSPDSAVHATTGQSAWQVGLKLKQQSAVCMLKQTDAQCHTAHFVPSCTAFTAHRGRLDLTQVCAEAHHADKIMLTGHPGQGSTPTAHGTNT